MCMYTYIHIYTIYYIIIHYYLLYLLNLCPSLYQMSHLWIPVSLRTAQYGVQRVWHQTENLGLKFEFDSGNKQKVFRIVKALDKETKCSLADIHPVAESTLFGSVSLSLSLREVVCEVCLRPVCLISSAVSSQIFSSLFIPVLCLHTWAVSAGDAEWGPKYTFKCRIRHYSHMGGLKRVILIVVRY